MHGRRLRRSPIKDLYTIGNHENFKTETEHEEYHDVNPTEDLNEAEMKEASKKKNTVKVKSQDQIEDEKGVTTNIKMPKVMKDGTTNRIHP